MELYKINPYTVREKSNEFQYSFLISHFPIWRRFLVSFSIIKEKTLLNSNMNSEPDTGLLSVSLLEEISMTALNGFKHGSFYVLLNYANYKNVIFLH